MISKCGRLVLVVGPSGVGKDTLIDYARERLQSDPDFNFVRRIITRPACVGENHEPVTLEEFGQRVSAGAFALNWEAHGLCYGLPTIIDHWLERGGVVVANCSRAMLPTARERYARLLVINVTVPSEILARRLSGRGREDESSRQQRLSRSDLYQVEGHDVLHIDNAGSPDIAGERFMDVLRACRRAAANDAAASLVE